MNAAGSITAPYGSRPNSLTTKSLFIVALCRKFYIGFKTINIDSIVWGDRFLLISKLKTFIIISAINLKLVQRIRKQNAIFIKYFFSAFFSMNKLHDIITLKT